MSLKVNLCFYKKITLTHILFMWFLQPHNVLHTGQEKICQSRYPNTKKTFCITFYSILYSNTMFSPWLSLFNYPVKLQRATTACFVRKHFMAMSDGVADSLNVLVLVLREVFIENSPPFLPQTKYCCRKCLINTFRK